MAKIHPADAEAQRCLEIQQQASQHSKLADRILLISMSLIILIFGLLIFILPHKTHILGHKSNFSKFKKVEIISSIFSDHKAMRLDINYKKKNCKKHKHMEIKQHVSK